MKSGKRSKRLMAAVLAVLVTFSAVNVGGGMSVYAQENQEEQSFIMTEGDGTDVSGFPDNEELFAGYVEGLLYPERKAAVFADYGKEVLEGLDLGIYRDLKPHIADLAASGGFTKCTVQLDSEIRWNPESIESISSEVWGKVEEQVNAKQVISCLMVDCPYELYWYDKTAGWTMGCAPLYTVDGTTGEIEAWVNSLWFSFKVAGAYQGDAADEETRTLTVDSAKAASIQAAVAAAQRIVAENSTKRDYDKLLAYKKAICDLADYNHEVAGNADTPYGDPWQLIYVFDGNPGTKVVCEGYAKAFQYLCDKSDFSGDVTCYTVTGETTAGNGAGRHMWNIVTIGGENYIADLTNSDAGSWGQDGSLFLTGTQGKVASGYTFKDQYNNTLHYAYDADTIRLYGDTILTLTNGVYVPKEENSITALRSFAKEYDGTPLTISKKKGTDLNWLGTGAATLTYYMDEAGTEVTTPANSGAASEGAAPIYAGNYYVKVSVAEDKTYEGAAATFPLTVSGKTLTEAMLSEIPAFAYYTGNAITPAVTVTDQGSVLMPDTDYTVSYANHTDVHNGTGADAPTITITGKGNYQGTLTKTFAIVYYDGTVDPKFNGAALSAGAYAEDVAVTAEGYTVSDSLNGPFAETYTIAKEGAQANVTLYFKQNDTGYITDGKSYTVKFDGKAPQITAMTAENITDTSADVQVQLDEAGTLCFTVAFDPNEEMTAEHLLENGNKLPVSAESHEIGLGSLQPFTTYYIYAVAADSAGNVGEVKECTFRTSKMALDASDVTLSAGGIYGTALIDLPVTAAGTVKTASGTTVAGTWVFTAGGDVYPAAGGQTGYEAVFVPTANPERYEMLKLSVIPDMAARALTAEGVTVGEVAGTFTYDGTAKTPAVTVSDSAALITADDYELSYENNTNAGLATVIITGKGNYTGTVEKTFTIDKAQANAVAPIIRSYVSTAGSNGNTVTIDIAALLPTDRGTTAYTLAGEAAYLSGQQVSAAGVLSYQVAATGAAGDSAALTVTAASQNYTDITVTVMIQLTDKLAVAEKKGSEVALTGNTDVVYGDVLSKLTLNTDTAVFVEEGTDKVVPGTLVWSNPTQSLKVGSSMAEWKFTPDDTALYAELTGSLEIYVSKAEQAAPTGLTARAETIFGKADGSISGLTERMEYSGNGTAYTPMEASMLNNGVFENLAAGTYYVRYQADLNHNASPAVTLTIAAGSKLSIQLPDTQTGYTITADETEVAYNGSVILSFTLDEGYNKQSNFTVKANGTPVTLDENGRVVLSDITETQTITVEGVADITAPTAAITVADNEWREFLNTITFGKFFKDTQTVTITAEDAGSGVGEISYYLADKAMTAAELETVDWMEYTKAFNIEPDGKYVIYAKAADVDGNETLINSDGLVLDATAGLISVTLDGTAYADGAEHNYTDSVQVAVSASDVLAGMKQASYRLDNAVAVTIAPAEGSSFTVSERGSHTLVVSGEDNAGNTVQKTVTFKVYKTPVVTLTPAAEIVYDGQAIEAGTDFTADFGGSGGTVTYSWKANGAENFTAGLPTEVGNYTIKAEITADDVNYYSAASATADITIASGSAVASVTLEGWTYGETAKTPVPASTTNGTDAVTYLYKVKGAADSTYTAAMPTNAGTYTVKAVFAATDNYPEVEATCDFTIAKAAGTGSVSLENWTYGETAKPPVPVSTTNGTDAVTYLYKVKGAADSTYTAVVPKNAGTYTVKAVFAATDNYEAVAATADFEILKADRPNVEKPDESTPLTAKPGTDTVKEVPLPEGWSWSDPDVKVIPGGYVEAPAVYDDRANYENQDSCEVVLTIAGGVQIIASATDEEYVIGKDSKAVITSDGAREELKSIRVDGKLLAPSSYTLDADASIITLQKAYLDTLSLGEHTVELYYTAASTEACLTVKKQEEKPAGGNEDTDSNTGNETDTGSGTGAAQITSPHTADTAKPELWMTWMLLSCAGAAGILLERRKRKVTVKEK